jgi:adenosylmethionine-8-amino-7-oxononanoate aminotransferase
VVEMVDDIDVEKTQNQLIKNGVWLRPYGKLLYTMPPFNITDDELSARNGEKSRLLLLQPLSTIR